MDDATKAVIASWVRHLLTIAAGAWGLETWLEPSLMDALVTLALAAIAIGWSTVSGRKKIRQLEAATKAASLVQYDPYRTRN